jgi:hypothetical protein
MSVPSMSNKTSRTMSGGEATRTRRAWQTQVGAGLTLGGESGIVGAR